MLRIDAHQHFWTHGGAFDHAWLRDAALERIRRDFLPAELAPELVKAGLDGSVVVQTLANPKENDWLLQLADQHGFIRGVVGWVDLRADDVDEQLQVLRAHPKFAGIRHPAPDGTDEDWLIRPRMLRGLAALERRNVPFDLLVRPSQLKHVPALTRKLPRLRMVIDHAAKPPLASGDLAAWRRDLKAAAANPNVSCKLSGLATEAHGDAWSAADLQPAVDAALEAFGPDRLMFGSDWPVCLLAGAYDRIVETLEETIRGLPAESRDRLWGGTAAEVYRLSR